MNTVRNSGPCQHEGGSVCGRHALPSIEGFQPARSSPGKPSDEAGPSMTSKPRSRVVRAPRQKSLPLQPTPLCARAADRVRLQDESMSRSCCSARKWIDLATPALE
ncbi:hypothetical protein MRX96_016546 [Rhipicephalus microplus]